MTRECPIPVQALNQPGGTEGMWLTPYLQQPPQPTIGPPHSYPRPGLTSMRAAKWTGPKQVTPRVPFFNPDLIANLVGWSNEAPVIVDGQKVTALIDLGAQVSSVSSGFCKWMTLKAARARGYQGLSHLVLGICRS